MIYHLYMQINSKCFRLLDPETGVFGEAFTCPRTQLSYITSFEIRKRMTCVQRKKNYTKLFEGTVEECLKEANEIREACLVIEALKR